jgi:hypothetical protein
VDGDVHIKQSVLYSYGTPPPWQVFMDFGAFFFVFMDFGAFFFVFVAPHLPYSSFISANSPIT